MSCAIGVLCKTHGFVHGKEAEELRNSIEALASNPKGCTQNELLQLLDKVDARDSLAFLETNLE